MTQFQYKPRRLKLHIDDPGLLDRLTELAAGLPFVKAIDFAAIALGVSRSTLSAFLKDNPEAKDAWQQGRIIKKAQFAKKGEQFAMVDPPTWRFLAKQHLGYSDNPKVDKPMGELAGAETKKLMSREEAIKRIMELQRKVPREIDGEAQEVHPTANQVTTGRALTRRG